MQKTAQLLLVCFFLILSGCESKRENTSGNLSGKITVDGKVLTGGTIFGRVGEIECSGFINFQGEYFLENPPLGDMQLKIVAVPPPPPGLEVNTGSANASQGLIPLENQNYSKSFAVRFEGGLQKFDIELSSKKTQPGK